MTTIRCRYVLLAGFLTGLALTGLPASAAPKAGKKTKKKKAPATVRVYVGTYTQGDSEGIYQFTLDTKKGKASQATLAAKSVDPSFVALHPSGKFLYAVNETTSWEGTENSGGLSAYTIDASSGRLDLMNQQPTRGAHPCHLVVNKAGTSVLVANYTGGSVISYGIEEDGCLGPEISFVQHTGSGVLKPRQASPHAHSINIDPSGRFAVTADLGLDKMLVYSFDAKKGSLTANKPAGTAVKPAAGPRHFSFHPNGKFGYVINEINMTVTAFAWNSKAGTLKELQTLSTLPPGKSVEKGMSTADVQVAVGGRFLFGSNRGHNTIVSYKINRKTGQLTYVGNFSTGGETPRNFGLDPSGRFLLAENQKSGTIHILRINRRTGELKPTGSVVKVPAPVCVKMLAVDQGS